MRLRTVQIKNFKHILDSSEVEIDDKITCLVGKNESGKSAFLEALRRLKPAQGAVKFDSAKHYPAWLEKKHRREAKAKDEDLDDTFPIAATFELEKTDHDAVEEVFGPGVLTSTEFTYKRRYNNSPLSVFDTDEAVAVKNFLGTYDPDKELATVHACTNFEELRTAIDAYTDGDDEDTAELRKELVAHLEKMLPKKAPMRTVIASKLAERVPKFFYYSEYSSLPSRVPIRRILDADPETLDENEQTALALLQLAEFEKDHLLDSDYETRKRELENTSNELKRQVLTYWSTNIHLNVMMDLTQKQVPNGSGYSSVIDELQVRMYDDKHMLSLPFDERSSGFRWFFSFLTAFSRYEFDKTPIIILLDEPALSLHAKAQKDFLRFIEERLSERCQVIYTTHSPFMIQPNKIERTRLIEDKGIERGAVVTADVLTTDRDTLFPLQSALGYDIAQHLFIAKDNLVLEGPSDFIYLDTISQHLRSLGRKGLNERWSMMPIGGADVIPAFVALLGNHLDVTVLVDSRKEGHQKLTALAKAGFLTDQRIIAVGELTGTAMADIEDLFETEDYLGLFNGAFGKQIKKSELKGSDPIVNQIARIIGERRFDHNKPADYLLRSKDKVLGKLSETTLANFEKLFIRINETLA
ncbi:ATP-dependent nuclease [Rhizobium sp. 'Codium 1']|uniref:ATP-dependent nuclease n=1 Tax=Rhizobium sp. 'Codium 1' TaxID=2940484 RepID=UPI001E64CCD4|nr:AAA family ATPase [Rhizobium sp. 'Codium 1']MCC8934850.1 ATP-binding protein [Rhizobium sp. 'Codium 1']